jgi:translation initiation factor 2 gamma subunit (eIF-2gamma)
MEAVDLTDYNSATTETPEIIQQRHQREWGQGYALVAIDLVGARNLLLTKNGITVNTAALLQSFSSVKECFNTGALKTARTICIALRPSYTNYDDIFEKIINDITTFLTENNY